MKRTMLLAGLCLALTATMRAQVVQKRETSDQAQQQLLQLNDEMAASFHHTDLLKVSEYFDDDATIYIDGNKVTGRKALSEFWNKITARKKMEISVDEMNGNGKFIYETGTLTMQTESNTVNKNFVMVWKRLPNFDYKIVVAGFN